MGGLNKTYEEQVDKCSFWGWGFVVKGVLIYCEQSDPFFTPVFMTPIKEYNSRSCVFVVASLTGKGHQTLYIHRNSTDLGKNISVCSV